MNTSDKNIFHIFLLKTSMKFIMNQKETFFLTELATFVLLYNFLPHPKPLPLCVVSSDNKKQGGKKLVVIMQINAHGNS